MIKHKRRAAAVLWQMQARSSHCSALLWGILSARYIDPTTPPPQGHDYHLSLEVGINTVTYPNPESGRPGNVAVQSSAFRRGIARYLTIISKPASLLFRSRVLSSVTRKYVLLVESPTSAMGAYSAHLICARPLAA